MTARNELRLLPWPGAEGRPCCLSTDDKGGYTSRLADNAEADQLATSASRLEHVSGTIDDGDANPEGLRRLAGD